MGRDITRKIGKYRYAQLIYMITKAQVYTYIKVYLHVIINFTDTHTTEPRSHYKKRITRIKKERKKERK